MNKLQTKIWEVSSDLDKKTELVRRSNIGNSEGSKFKSVKELKKKLDEMKTKADEISAAEVNKRILLLQSIICIINLSNFSVVGRPRLKKRRVRNIAVSISKRCINRKYTVPGINLSIKCTD